MVHNSCDSPPKSFDLSVIPALTHRNGWAWRIGVPKRKGIGAVEFRRFYEDAVAGRIADAAGFTWPSSDILTPEQLAYARANLDPKDFREQFEASFETAGGQIFHAFSRARNVRPCTYNPALPLVVGCDFNVDPMAWVVGHRYANRLEWIDELFLRDTNTVATLGVLWSRYAQHRGGFEFYPDASGAQRKTSASESDYLLILNDKRFDRAGRNVFKPGGNPRIADRFADCNALFQNADGESRMHVAPHCVHLIDDLETRAYKPGTSEPADPPGSDVGHMTDAMGYACAYLFPIRDEYFSATPSVMIRAGATR